MIIKDKRSKKKSGKQKKAELEKEAIMDSRNMLALMVASAATSWKTGIPYADLVAKAENRNLKPDTFFLDIADTIGTMFTMVEAETTSSADNNNLETEEK